MKKPSVRWFTALSTVALLAGSAQVANAQTPAAAPPAAPAAAPAGDSIVVLATHSEPKPADPVKVTIQSFKVTKAKFDPAKVVGGSAEIELDLASLKSDSEKRDGHLKSADYIDTAKYGTATIAIANVKKAGDNKYTAKATVKVRGKTVKVPVAFEVVETTADGIRVKGEHKIKRSQIGVGKAKGDSVADELTVQLDLTLKNT